MNPTIAKKERIISLDIIRGIALFGIMLINIPAYQVVMEGDILPVNSGMNHYVDMLIHILVEKKFFSIFSFLFGIGFYIFTSRAQQRGDKPRWRFVRRLLSLLVLGIIHAIIFWGSILAAYAVIGFLLLPFYRVQISTIKKWLAGFTCVYLIALIMALVIPTMASSMTSIGNDDAVLVYIMFLAGFLVAKADWPRQIGRLQKQVRWIQIVTLPIVICFSVWIWMSMQQDAENVNLIISLGTIPAVLFYLSTMFLVLENKTIVHLLQPVARVGQMALTNYVAQSFIALTIMSLMGIKFVSPSQTVLIASIIFIIQILFSVLWFKFFKMGPLEKLWRFMTYGRKNPTTNR
ncbi:DUF418 domain-containing protein [Sporosarcina sp. FSL K6-6792]|uniref:DUF418 domain-containing protein n=1 Tax=Sporosarcina sp. FSL K6-6792 TaxID=2921559 RepID=UPI0030F979ED